MLPKSETAKSINYCPNQETHLKVFLSDGEVPIDNLARAIIYSVTEAAWANCLNVYYYMKHLLTELTWIVRTDGSIDEKRFGTTYAAVKRSFG